MDNKMREEIGMLAEIYTSKRHYYRCTGRHRDQQEEALDRLIAALTQRAAAPEGWKLVPAEPTVFMLLVGVEQSFRGSPHTTNGVAGIYRAMLAAVEDK